MSWKTCNALNAFLKLERIPMKKCLIFILGIAYSLVSSPIQAENKSASTDNLNYKAVTLYKQKKFDEALELINQSIKKDPDNTFSIGLRAATYLALDRFSEARKDFVIVAKMKPDDAFINFNIGETYFLAKEYTKAKASFKKFLELEPNNELGLFKVFLCDLLSGQKEAIDERISTLTPSPVSPFYYFAHAGLNFYKKDNDDAHDYLSRATEIYPRNQILTFLDSFRELGWIDYEDLDEGAVVSADNIRNMSSKSFHAEQKEISVLSKLEALMPIEDEKENNKKKK